MNKLEIVITEKAKADIRKIKNYIAKDNQTAAKEFLVKLRKTFVNLSVYPKIGKSRPEFSDNKDILFLPVLTNYLVVYSIINSKLYIVRVLSNYQNICAII